MDEQVYIWKVASKEQIEPEDWPIGNIMAMEELDEDNTVEEVVVGIHWAEGILVVLVQVQVDQVVDKYSVVYSTEDMAAVELDNSSAPSTTTTTTNSHFARSPLTCHVTIWARALQQPFTMAFSS